MTLLLILGLAAAAVQVMCAHNEHYGAASGWGAIQMVLLWVFFLVKEIG